MFSKIKKYVIGFFVLLGGILLAFFSGKGAGRSKERRKDIDKKLDIVKEALKSNKKYKKDVQDLLKDKKKELEKLKKVKEKKVKDISADKAADFLKKYAKKDK
jgi:DNA-binding transcriptional regulator GbsR (MarR family)